MMRMMIGAVLGTAVMAASAAAGATAVGGDQVVRMDDDEDPPAPLAFSLYRVTGRHECSIEGSSMTFTCDVAKSQQKSCDQGHAALVADDCCARTREGSVSTELMNFTCTPQ